MKINYVNLMTLEDDSKENVNLKDKTKEFSSIIHTMRHDIRNYIAAIEGFAYLLKDEFNEDYLNRIFSNITNISELVDRSVLLVDADLEIEKNSEIDLDIVMKTFRGELPSNIEFSCDKLAKVQGDYTKIVHLFKTLFDSSILRSEPNKIEIKSISTNEGYYIIQILNDGKKIPQNQVQKLFDEVPQSLKPNTGVNLLISKKIAKAHNWDIRYNENIENMCCFEVLIPVKSIIN